MKKFSDWFKGLDSIPNTDGDRYQQEYRIQARDTNIRSNETATPSTGEIKESLITKFEAKKYDLWRLLNFQADYFCNLWNVKSEDARLNDKMHIINRTCFLYGEAIMYKLGNEIIPCYVVNKSVNYLGDILDCTIASAYQAMDSKAVLTKTADSDAFTKFEVSGDDLKNIVHYKWDSQAYGAYYKFLPFINILTSLMNMLNADGISHIKKFLYEVNDPAAVKNEMEILFDEESPVGYTMAGSEDSMGIQNKIKTNDMHNSSSTNSLLEYMTYTINYYYTMLGRRINTDDKKERNITSEVKSTQNNFDILENEHKLYFESFVEGVEKLTGVKFEKVFAGDTETENNGEQDKEVKDEV